MRIIFHQTSSAKCLAFFQKTYFQKYLNLYFRLLSDTHYNFQSIIIYKLQSNLFCFSRRWDFLSRLCAYILGKVRKKRTNKRNASQLLRNLLCSLFNSRYCQVVDKRRNPQCHEKYHYCILLKIIGNVYCEHSGL